MYSTARIAQLSGCSNSQRIYIIAQLSTYSKRSANWEQQLTIIMILLYQLGTTGFVLLVVKGASEARGQVI